MRFDELLENDDLLDALWDMHFDDMTPIQEKSIPLVIEGHDILACAQTGTGKTAAYLLPVIDLICSGNFPDDKVNCIIMAPTRELAQQIDQQMQGFSYFLPISSLPIYGGTDGYTYDQQRKGLKSGADVVIATPGRLIAHLQMGSVDLSQVSFFILDEADRMLDMGFYDDIMSIVKFLPKERQTLLFSATMPSKIRDLAKSILNNPKEIILALSRPADKIDQKVYYCHEEGKVTLLKYLISRGEYSRIIVFSSSKQKVKELAAKLSGGRFRVGDMHSDLEQNKREETMLQFKAGRINILVATDIVARGIDIDNIDLVVNFDVPAEGEDYIHRVGRTARAEKDGKAITFVNIRDRRRFKNIEKLLGKAVPKGDLPEELKGKIPEESQKTTKSEKSRTGSRRFNKNKVKRRFTGKEKRSSDNMREVTS